MKRATVLMLAAASMLAAGIRGAEAWDSKGKSVISVSGGVQATTSFATQVVVQGTSDTPATIGFGTGGNDFRDSGEAVKVSVNTNVANNRIIIYTENLSATANPKACLDTSTGIDGGGLVGVTDCSQAVPLLWVVADTNVDHTFTTAVIGDDEIFVTDHAHVASFTNTGSALDNKAMVLCRNPATAIPNPANNGLYPQFFGNPGLNEDLCDAAAPTTVVSQELSKNIAVVAHSFSGTVGTAPNLTTPDPADSITVTSPIYLPIGADFIGAAPQDYATSTLTLELVTQ